MGVFSSLKIHPLWYIVAYFLVYHNGCTLKIHPLKYTKKYTSTGVFLGYHRWKYTRWCTFWLYHLHRPIFIINPFSEDFVNHVRCEYIVIYSFGIFVNVVNLMKYNFSCNHKCYWTKAKNMIILELLLCVLYFINVQLPMCLILPRLASN